MMAIGITISSLVPVSAKEMNYANDEVLTLNDYESMSELELNAWKVGLWSYRCTVEYDKWAK